MISSLFEMKKKLLLGPNFNKVEVFFNSGLKAIFQLIEAILDLA